MKVSTYGDGRYEIYVTLCGGVMTPVYISNPLYSPHEGSKLEQIVIDDFITYL